MFMHNPNFKNRIYPDLGRMQGYGYGERSAFRAGAVLEKPKFGSGNCKDAKELYLTCAIDKPPKIRGEALSYDCPDLRQPLAQGRIRQRGGHHHRPAQRREARAGFRQGEHETCLVTEVRAANRPDICESRGFHFPFCGLNPCFRDVAAVIFCLAAQLVLSLATLRAESLPRYQIEPLDPAVRQAFLEGRSAPHVLTDEGWRVWCNSVIRWKDGKYHCYYSRWPEASGFASWLTHCEIAHGVADKPEGPFVFQNVAITSRRAGAWDIVNAHNPYAMTAEGKVCLFYCSNAIADKFPATAADALPSDEWLVENRTLIRNSQVTGVAIADDPAGPFVRSTHLVVQPHGRFKNIAVNPAVVYRNGRYVMIIKGDDVRHEKPFRIQFVGYSDKPDGPYAFLDQPVYAARESEDACLWYDQTTKRFNMVCHVINTDDLAWFVSEDGEHWRPSETPVFMKKEFQMTDGSLWKPKRVERPFVLTDELGRPQMIYVAVLDGNRQGNLALKITADTKEPAETEAASVPHR